MRKATAAWTIEMWVSCPSCKNYIDVSFEKVDEWWHEFGLPGETKEDLDYQIHCDECHETFIIDKTEY